MARFCPLFSGSTGNSTYIYANGRGILVDAGVSYKRLREALAAAGSSAEEICAVAVTHEHTDHIKGLKTLLKSLSVPLIASSETLRILQAQELIPPDTVLIPADSGEITVGDFAVRRFDTRHDCPGSGGYSVSLPDGRRVAVCTDLGTVTETVREHITGSTALLIESNHDVNLLKSSPYPPALKLRILSDEGHLSNTACACELARLVNTGTTRIILGHISQNSNLPTLALSSSRTALAEAGIIAGTDCLLSAASPERNSVTAI